MYHTVHNQLETRAPIRAMTFAEIRGKAYLLAAYLCTPLVSIPLNSLKDGAHIRAKTITELGESGIPVDLLTYGVDNPMTHEHATFLLAVNLFAQAPIHLVGGDRGCQPPRRPVVTCASLRSAWTAQDDRPPPGIGNARGQSE